MDDAGVHEGRRAGAAIRPTPRTTAILQVLHHLSAEHPSAYGRGLYDDGANRDQRSINARKP
jgi:hypothetical protein